ncbi:MAG: FAD-dependent oxidoreductase [Alphaproteobacteria bacterium]|nr:FAD-dependent oxidoreductase [Alphaproteobacteria bacterium]
MRTGTLIVGGGLAGLSLADALQARGQDFILVEARARLGGRILTERHAGGSFDLGPAWFWPGQTRIAALVDRFGLEVFEQFADGILTFENDRGEVQRGRGFASMQGSLRLRGGLDRLTDALSDGLPEDRKHLNAEVTALKQSGGSIHATLGNAKTIVADHVVLALPPRVAARIDFQPALPESAIRSMCAIATWMAGQAKAVAVYDRPFWRDAGLSGNAMSQTGPMVEIHDASAADNGPYALFGFIGVPPAARLNETALHRQLTAQLGRLFGAEAAQPVHLAVKDWAFDPHTATEADGAPLFVHPEYGLPPSLTNLWDNRLHFGGTEVARLFGGYIEGALEAAESALAHLTSE